MIRIAANKSQDSNMISYGQRNYKKQYSVLRNVSVKARMHELNNALSGKQYSSKSVTESCSNLSGGIMDAGDITFSNTTIPNGQFFDVLLNNDAKIIKDE